jgi:replicative DNA helicase
MEELEAEYIEQLKLAKERVLNLANWIPTLGRKCRGLVPGEMVTIVAATGVGKTALLQNLAKAARPLPTLLFEMELPGSLTFERFCAISEGVPCQCVENEYAAGNRYQWQQSGHLNHIFTCTRSRLTPDLVELMINKAELKMGCRPALVLIDYIQLIGGKGLKRYEVVSDAAEDLKRIAKATKTIIVLASQLKRKDDSDIEVTLTDAKESGAIENSSGLVLGVWRPEQNEMHIRILKNTKGRADKKGEHVVCNFDGPTLTITERVESVIDARDVPPGCHPYQSDP